MVGCPDKCFRYRDWCRATFFTLIIFYPFWFELPLTCVKVSIFFISAVNNVPIAHPRYVAINQSTLTYIKYSS